MKTKTKPETQRVKRPTRGGFAPLAQVPPLAFLVSFSFSFTFNFNYGAKSMRGGVIITNSRLQWIVSIFLHVCSMIMFVPWLIYPSNDVTKVYDNDYEYWSFFPRNCEVEVFSKCSCWAKQLISSCKIYWIRISFLISTL